MKEKIDCQSDDRSIKNGGTICEEVNGELVFRSSCKEA